MTLDVIGDAVFVSPQCLLHKCQAPLSSNEYSVYCMETFTGKEPSVPDLNEQRNVFSLPVPPPLATPAKYNNRLMGDKVKGINNMILPCPQEVAETLCKMSAADPAIQTTAAINCTLSSCDNAVSGWYTVFPPDTPVGAIPFPPNMFDGITVVETLASESQILDLLKDRASVLQKMQTHAATLCSNNVKNRASWQACRPERTVPLQRRQGWKVVMRQDNVSRYMTVQHSQDNGGSTCIKVSADAPLDFVPDESIPNYVDSAPWAPELSDDSFIGLYHQWYTGISGKRELKLYFVCQSRCQKAGLEIKHLVNDIPQSAPLSSLAKSEEIWWLRNTNSRNRNRLILSFARILGIDVPVAEDHHASETGVQMAYPLTETLLHSIYEYRDGRIGIANECIPTAFVANGMVCRMAPWEGIWIFGGARAATIFGGPFGSEHTVFPLTTIKLTPQTEQQAQTRHHVIQRASPLDYESTWFDAQFQINHSEQVLRQWQKQQQYKKKEQMRQDGLESIFDNVFQDDDEGFDLDKAVEMNQSPLFTGGMHGLEAYLMQHYPTPTSPSFGTGCIMPTVLFVNNRWGFVWQEEAVSTAGFPGIEDSTLYSIALQAWKQAQHEKLRVAECALPAQNVGHDYNPAYISFDNDIVTTKLKTVSWDPQNGTLRLIPLCVCTS